MAVPDYKITQSVELPHKHFPIVSIGAGGIVKDSHYPAYRKVGFPVAGLYDIDPKRASQMAQAFTIPVIYPSLDAALTQSPSDAIFDIALPANVILDVLPRIPDGRSVLIQKPMGATLEEARKIRDLCHDKHLTAAVNFQLRFAPFVNIARGLIEQGAIGTLHDMEVRVTVFTPWPIWTFLLGIPRVEILYHSIHYLDLIRSFLGEPHSIYAKTIQHPKQTQLASTRSTMILDYGNLMRCSVETNHGHDFGRKHQESYVKWEGTKGAIIGTLGVNLDYPVGEPDSLEYCVLDDEGKPVSDPNAWKSIPVEGRWFPDAFIGPMAALMRFTEGSSSILPTSVDDAYKTMALVEAAYLSSDAGGTPIPS